MLSLVLGVSEPVCDWARQRWWHLLRERGLCGGNRVRTPLPAAVGPAAHTGPCGEGLWAEPGVPIFCGAGQGWAGDTALRSV